MSLTWFVIRGSGIVAFGLLTASLVWGLMVSSKVLGRAVKAKGLQWLHESLGLGALLATVVHVVAVWLDEFIEFTWLDILLPGAAEWEPLATALGVVGLWTLAIVSLSFYVKRWIGQSAWRFMHYLSFGAFLAALSHGAIAGTDTGNPMLVGLYLSSLVAVVMLTAIRVLTSREPKSRPSLG
ncbi:MAG: hypothetical protein ABFS21_02705 [Actinomycetota bacterium]